MRPIILLLIVCTSIFTATVFAQAPPPAPPAPKNTPPNVVSSTKFTSKKGGYAVSFPGRPTNSVTQIDTSFGKASMVIDSLSTTLASYAVVHINFPTDLVDRYELDARFDVLRDSHLQETKGRLVKDSIFFFGSLYGREIVIEAKSVTMSVRTFIAGPRFFEVGIITPGVLSTQSAKLRKANEARIKKFFDSFELTSVPEAKEQRVALPSDFGLSFADNVFSSKFLEVSIVVPPDLKRSDDTGETIFELGKDRLKEVDTALSEYISADTTKLLASFLNTDAEAGVMSAGMMIFAERAPYPNFLPKAVVDTLKPRYDANSNFEILGTGTTKIGGIDLAWMEWSDVKSGTTFCMYVANRSGVAFEIMLFYRDENDRQMLLDSIKTLKSASKK